MDYLIIDKPCKVKKEFKLKQGYSIKMYDLDRHTSTTVNGSGALYNAISKILIAQDYDGKYVNIKPHIDDNGMLSLELCDLESKELKNTLLDLMSLTTNFRFNAFVFNSDDNSLLNLGGDLIEEVKNNAIQLTRDAFVKLVEEISRNYNQATGGDL